MVPGGRENAWPHAPVLEPLGWRLESRRSAPPPWTEASSGDATAAFSNVQVTAATTAALPLLNMGPALTGSVTGNTLTGGALMFNNGAWEITANTDNGARCGHVRRGGVLVLHGPRPQPLEQHLSQLSPYGKTFRMLSVGNGESWGSNDVISGNTVQNGAGNGRPRGRLGLGPERRDLRHPQPGRVHPVRVFRHLLRGEPLRAFRGRPRVDDSLCSGRSALDGGRRGHPQWA